MEEHVREAEKQGLLQLGFSSHAPVPFENKFAISEEDLPEYIREIDRLKSQTDVCLLKALECDFIPGMTVDFADRKSVNGLDYVIGGVHLVRPPHGDGLWFIDGPKQEIYDNDLRELFHSGRRCLLWGDPAKRAGQSGRYASRACQKHGL